MQNKPESSDSRTWAFPASVAKLLTTGEFSDLLIKCRDREFHAHRAIVCVQSEYLRDKLCYSIHNAVDEIDLSEHSVEHVEILLGFLYKGELVFPTANTTETIDLETSTTPTPKNPLVQFAKAKGINTTIESEPVDHSPPSTIERKQANPAYSLVSLTELYVFTQKIQVGPLRHLVGCEYRMQLSARNQESGDFVKSLRILLEESENLDLPLLQYSINWASRHVKDFVDKEGFHPLCQEFPKLAVEILKAMASNPQGPLGQDSGRRGNERDGSVETAGGKGDAKVAKKTNGSTAGQSARGNRKK